MAKYNVISADAHLETPPTDWVERMPAHLRSEAPQVVKLDTGGDGVSVAGKPPAPLGLQLTGGQKFNEFVTRGRSFSDKLPGSGDPAQRLREQDQDGTDAELMYCAVVQTALKSIKNPVVLKEIAKAYNAYLNDFCSHSPDRLFGAALIPPTNIDDAMEELERISNYKAVRAACLITFPNGSEWGTYGDEPFWKAASDMGLCVTAHHNFGGEDKGKSHPLAGQKDKALQLDGEVDLAHFAWLLTCDMPIPTIPILTIEQLFLGGVFDRHPNIRFHFAETGIGWLPYWLEQMDDRFERHRHWAKVKLNKKPSDYVRQHVTFSFQEDHAGTRNRDLIGIDNICWASDFPHSVGDWPYSRETRERQFKSLPDNERRKLEALNIATQLGVISKEEKEALAQEPISRKVEALKIPARGERRGG